MKKPLFYLAIITIFLIPVYFLVVNFEPKAEISSTENKPNNYRSPEEKLRAEILTCLEQEKSEDEEFNLKVQKVIECFQVRHHGAEEHLTRLEGFLIEVANIDKETPPNLAKLQDLVCQYRKYLDNYWKNIHLEFKDESLREEWLKRGFSKEQVKMWIDIKTKPDEFEFTYWLVNEKGGNYADPTWILNYGDDEALLKEWKENKKPPISTENDWFSEKKWLTDKEIDWATDRISRSNKFKILSAHQFYYTVEAGKKAESNAYLAFPQLLSDINDKNVSLVFIPVNNPDFHWSLLVYEVAKRRFWHFDTLKGINYDYAKPLVKELVQQITEKNSFNLDEYLIKKHNISQNNNYDCGVAVISIIKRIIENWDSFLKKNRKWILSDNLGDFDFKQERKELWERYLKN